MAEAAARVAGLMAVQPNIEYSYGSGGAAEAGILVMRVSDMERANEGARVGRLGRWIISGHAPQWGYALLKTPAISPQ